MGQWSVSLGHRQEEVERDGLRKYSKRNVQEGTGNSDLELWMRVELEMLSVGFGSYLASESMTLAGERAHKLNTLWDIQSATFHVTSHRVLGSHVLYVVYPSLLSSSMWIPQPLYRPHYPNLFTLSRGLSQAPSLSSSFPRLFGLIYFSSKRYQLRDTN